MDNEQEYITITQVAAELGWNKATVYDWVKTLGIEKHRFLRNKNTYLHTTDVQRLKEIKAKPWTAGPNTARTTRGITEKVEKPPASPPMVQTEAVAEKNGKRVYKRKQDASLPDGCILASKFAESHGIARPTFIDHMNRGLGPGLIGASTDTIPQREQVNYSERPKPNRPTEKERFLTYEQQKAAFEFWQHHSIDYSQCNDFGCWCHQVKNGE